MRPVSISRLHEEKKQKQQIQIKHERENCRNY